MKNIPKQILLLLVIFTLLIGTLTGCQSFKDYLQTNKETLKDVVKSLVGEIVDAIFKELLDNQKLQTTLDRSVNRSLLPGKNISEVSYTPAQIAQLKEELKKRITIAIDNKEIKIDDTLIK